MRAPTEQDVRIGCVIITMTGTVLWLILAIMGDSFLYGSAVVWGLVAVWMIVCIRKNRTWYPWERLRR